MPIRGENIGTAYVRIVGDGSGLDESIRDAFNDAEPSVREGAREHADAYDEEYNKQLRKSFKGNFGKTQKDMFDEMNKSLASSLARLELSDRFFKSAKWREFRTRLGDEFGAAGELAGQRLEERFRDSTDLSSMAAKMRDIGPEIRKAQHDILVEMQSEALQMNAEFDRKLRDQTRAAVQAQEHIQRLGLLQERAIAEDRRRTLQRLRGDYADYLDDLHKVERGERGASRSRSELIDGLRRLRYEADRAHVPLHTIGEDFEGLARRVATSTPHLSRFNGQLDRFALLGGRAFGRGSRNDFLNVIGGMVTGALRLAFIMPKALEKVTQFGRGLVDTFLAKGGGVGGAGAVLSSLAGSSLALAGGLAAVGVALAAVAVIIGPIIALFSGLLGIITALAASITFGLIGAIAPLVGLIPALASSLGVLGLAFIGMGDKAKKALLEDVKPLLSGLKDLGAVAREELFSNLGPQVEEFGRVFASLRPLVKGVADGMRDSFNGWADDLDSPGFRQWVRVMTAVLPGMIRQLGDILSNTFGGLGGIFRALIPITQHFLTWLQEITQEFQDWANSKQGREDLMEFFERAGDSAKQLGGLIGELVGLISDLFDAGKDTGDSFIEDLTNQVKRLRDFLADNPDALEKWFKDAKQLWEDLGTAAEGAKDLMNQLNSKEAKESLHLILQTIGFIAEALAIAQGIAEEFWAPFEAGLELIRRIKDAISSIDLKGTFSGFGGINPKAILAPFNGLNAKIVKAIGKVDVSGIIKGIPGALGSLLGGFSGAAGKILKRIGKVNVSGIITGVIGAVASLINPFVGTNTKVLRTIGKVGVQNIITGVQAALGSLINPFKPGARMILGAIGKVNVAGIIVGAAAAANALVDAFRGLAGRIVEAIGTIVPHIKIPDIPGIPGIATGGMFGRVTSGPMLRWVGEDGPEAIVPLNRPLDQVDPSVRWLSALAQGKGNIPGAATGVTTPGKQITIEQMTIVSPNTDTRAVARSVVDQLAVVGY